MASGRPKTVENGSPLPRIFSAWERVRVRAVIWAMVEFPKEAHENEVHGLSQNFKPSVPARLAAEILSHLKVYLPPTSAARACRPYTSVSAAAPAQPSTHRAA